MIYLNIFIVVFCSIIMPIGLALYFVNQDHRYLKTMLFAGLTFFIARFLVIGPFEDVLDAIGTSLLGWEFTLSLTYNIVIYFSIGILLETIRYFVIKFWLKEYRGLKHAVAFGIGFSGVAGIVGLVMSLVNFWNIPDLLPRIVYWQGIQQLGQILRHIFYSVIVMKSVETRRISLLYIAMTVNILFNIFEMILHRFVEPLWMGQLVILCIAMVSLVYFIKKYTFEVDKQRADYLS